MSIAFPPRVAAAVRGRASVLFVGLSLAALALGGCGQRMAVSVNGQAVSQEQFYRQCAEFETQGILSPPVGLFVINQVIQQQLMTQEAKRLNLEPSAAEVNAELGSLRKQMTSNGQSLEQRLKQIGLPLDTLKDEIRLRVMQRKLMTQGVTVSDKEIEQFYNQNKLTPQFTTPEQVEVQQITVPNEAAAKEVKQTLDKNADFRLVAQTKSIDQYKDQGGTLPTLQRGYGVPPGVSPVVFAEALKTPEGKVAGPLKVGNNWVILKVKTKKPQVTRTLAEAKDEIRQMLLMQKAQQSGQVTKFSQRMMELQRDASIEVGLDQFKQLIRDEQKMFKQAPTPGMTPVLPSGR